MHLFPSFIINMFMQYHVLHMFGARIAPVHHQAIIWTNDGLVYWCIYVSLSLDVLTIVKIFVWLQETWPDGVSKQSKVVHAVLDTLLWQGLASVIIPGFTINRICFATNAILKRTTSLPSPIRKWTTTAVGLGCIPIIIKPIDHSVDFGMNNTVRRWYRIDPKEQQIVHHERYD